MQALFVKPHVLAVLDSNVSSEEGDSMDGSLSSENSVRLDTTSKSYLNASSNYDISIREVEELDKEAE